MASKKATKHCMIGAHKWQSTRRGKRHCEECGLVPCPIGECDLSLHPVPLTTYPPSYDAVCRKCGERTVWNPMAGASLDDPHVLAHDHDAVARQFGHVPRDVKAEDDAKFQEALMQMAALAKAKEPN